MLPREALHLSARSQCLTTDKNQRMKTQQKKSYPLLPCRGTDPFPRGKLNGTHPAGHRQGKGTEEEVCRANPQPFLRTSCTVSHSLGVAVPDQG